ncbi:MAG: heavy-metal-associated domain-containing protein [Clostridia bacterium]|nr:heavy-metal-associated domain-containing protein [Clostridia bacterium]
MVKITVGIDGMMCGMCEAHINDAIRGVLSVKKVSSSHANGETVIITVVSPDEQTVRAAIEKSGYKVISYNEEPYEKRGFFASLFGKK